MVTFGFNDVHIAVLIVAFHMFWLIIAAIVFPIAYDVSRKNDKSFIDPDSIEVLKPSTRWNNLQPLRPVPPKPTYPPRQKKHR